MRECRESFDEGISEKIHKTLEELIAAKDVRPGIFRKMANVLNKDNKNKELEKMKKNMEKMQEEVKKLRDDIKWLEQIKMQENVNELAEKIKELDKDEVSLPDDPKKEFAYDKENREAALKSYVNGGPEEGSEEDKKLKKFEENVFDEWYSKDGNSQKLDPMPPTVKEYYIRNGRDPEKIDYKTEIKNRYIV